MQKEFLARLIVPMIGHPAYCGGNRIQVTRNLTSIPGSSRFPQSVDKSRKMANKLSVQS